MLEVTLRTPAALEAIREMAAVPGGVVGAGTLITPADVKAAKEAGALFGVSPGVTDELLAACEAEELPLLGGIATVSEAMRMLARGYDVCKFFPAEANGGAPALKSFAGPLPQVHFCPTGGVTPQNAPDYLKLPNVLCVGGSWVASAALMKAGSGTRSRRSRAPRASSRDERRDRADLDRARRGRRRGAAPAHRHAVRPQPGPLPRVLGAAWTTCCSTSPRPTSTPTR